MFITDLKVTYDRSVDILAIKIIGTIPHIGVELSPKIISQFQINNSPAGITIIDFSDLHDDQLYDAVDDFLSNSAISNYDLLKLIGDAIDEKK